MPYDLIIKAMSYGFFFRARDEEGNLSPSDFSFLKSLSLNFDKTIREVLLFDPIADRPVIDKLREYYLLNKSEM